MTHKTEDQKDSIEVSNPRFTIKKGAFVINFIAKLHQKMKPARKKTHKTIIEKKRKRVHTTPAPPTSKEIQKIPAPSRRSNKTTGENPGGDPAARTTSEEKADPSKTLPRSLLTTKGGTR